MSTKDDSAVESELRINRRNDALWLVLNRLESRNALSLRLLETLRDALSAAANDRTVRVVVVAAEGSAFCSGHDLSELRSIDDAAAARIFSTCEHVMLSLRRLPQPAIARVQGPAVAAGCQLAASCDLIVAAESATFATPGVRIGLFCATPMVPLARAIPAKPALEMLLTGAPIAARRAFELGLANRVVPSPELDAAVDELIAVLRAQSAETLRAGKAAFYAWQARSEEQAYQHATPFMIEHVTTETAREGIAAFLEKRQPHRPN